MKYFQRSLRYMVRLLVLLAIVFLVMHLTGTLKLPVRELIATIFTSVNGIILLSLIVLLSAAYPKYSFATVFSAAGYDKARLCRTFESLGYALQEDTREQMVFRATGTLRRVLMQYDDPVTVIPCGDGVQIEGLKKVVVRVRARLESPEFN